MTAEGLKTFCGTPQYFAPEVLRRSHTVKGDGRYGKEIDCWSIGVILFILLSGSPPFDVSAGFDAVANAKVVFYDDQWKDVSREARDLVMRLLEKDPRRRMSVRDACRHAWVLVDDGDTHCHPLHDPLVAKDGSSAVPASSAEVNRDQAGEAEAKLANGSTGTGSDYKDDQEVKKATCNQSNEKGQASEAPSQPPPKPVDAMPSNALSPIEISLQNRKINQHRFQSMSAPQLSKDERKSSIWPSQKDDTIATKSDKDTCADSRSSPSRSSPMKKKLFNKSSTTTAANVVDSVPKKMTKQGVESIKAAGNTLPTPVISKDSHLVKKVAAPKKKIQSTLFPLSGTSKQPTKCAVKPAAADNAPQVPEEQDNQNKKRKALDTPSVTPPGGTETDNNVGLVFQLNKKVKVGGKNISPDAGQPAASSGGAAAAPAKKKKDELSEDELQSDFSDDDSTAVPLAAANSPMKSDKKPLERYLQKRKMDSIESASVDVGRGKPQSTEPLNDQRQKKSDEAEPRRVSKSPENPLNDEVAGRTNSDSSIKGKDRKLVQSFLFGKPPPDNSDLPNDTDPTLAESLPSNNEEPANVDGRPIQPNEMQVDGAELERQGSTGSGGTVSNTPPKGKQRSIKSWFQPKK